MYKNVKSKIILIIVLIGLILIGTLGFLYLNSLAQIPQLISFQGNTGLIDSEIQNVYGQAKKSVGIVVGIYMISAIAISAYLSKFVICPKNKYI